MGDLLLGAIGGFAASEILGGDDGHSRKAFYLAGVAAGVKMADKRAEQLLRLEQEERENKLLQEVTELPGDVIFGAAMAPRMEGQDCYQCRSTNSIITTRRKLPAYSDSRCVVCGEVRAWRMEWADFTSYPGNKKTREICRMEHLVPGLSKSPSGPAYEAEKRRWDKERKKCEEEEARNWLPSFFSRLFGGK